MSFIFGNFKSIFNIFQLNLLIFIQKFLYKKKIVIFYYPKNRLVKNNISFISDHFLNQKNFFIFYGATTTINLKNFFFIKQSYLKFIFNIDLFISNNICNKFSLKSKKIYIHHDIYDTPLAEKKKEKELKLSFLKYDFIIVASKKVQKFLLIFLKIQL